MTITQTLVDRRRQADGRDHDVRHAKARRRRRRPTPRASVRGLDSRRAPVSERTPGLFSLYRGLPRTLSEAPTLRTVRCRGLCPRCHFERLARTPRPPSVPSPDRPSPARFPPRGASTNSRSRKRGCGISRPSVRDHAYRRRGSDPDRACARRGTTGARGRARVRSPAARPAAPRGSSVVSPTTTAFRYGGCSSGTSTGAVSMMDETRGRLRRRARSRSIAHSRCARRSPRFEPRAMATGLRFRVEVGANSDSN